MSGIYIKGMEMPTVNKIIMITGGGDIWEIVDPFNESHDQYLVGAMAIPVPDHGRLIDADALADVFRGFIAMYDSCPFSQLSLSDKARRDELQSALAEVINAPTIIPAEEGE